MEKAELIKKVVELQRRVNRVLRRQVPDAWLQLNITIPQLKSLFFISNQGSTSVGKLAAALGVTPANVTGIIDRLVEQGLVSRTENPEDRRMLVLRVTERGQALITDLRERQISRLSKVLSRLSPEELSTLAEGLALMLRACELYRGEPQDEHD
jgi:DNA-binding MarR family transcriptional regulator